MSTYYGGITDVMAELRSIRDTLRRDSIRAMEKNNLIEYGKVNAKERMLGEIFKVCNDLLAKDRRQDTNES